MRAVIDTSVLVAAVRSPNGASNAILNMVLRAEFTPLVSVPLVLEYEAVLTRPEHLTAESDAKANVKIVRAFCDMGEPVHLTHRLRPQLVDADDEFVLETAYHGRADAIITLNTRDFLSAARRFGIATLEPRKALERIRQG